jgi:hypothetical protein
MNKSSLPTWLSGLCALLLAAVLAVQLKENARLKALERQQADLATAVNQQTAVLHRALGEVIPVELPDSLTKRLRALEARISDEKSWPKTSTETDKMLAELRELVRQIPPWAEEDLLPRLNALRWGVQSLQVLQANANADGEALATAAESLANQISVQPDGGSTNIAAILASRQTATTQRFAEYRRESAIKAAKEQLGRPVTMQAQTVWQQSSEWTNDPTRGQQVIELRQQLRSRLLEDDIIKFVEATKTNLQRLDGMTNDSLRAVGYVRALDALTVQRLNLLEQSDVPQDARNALDNFSKTVEETVKGEAGKQRDLERRRSRDYQAWALKQIEAFDAGYELVIQKNVSERERVMRDNILKNSLKTLHLVYGLVWTEAQVLAVKPDYKSVAADMTQYLLPISPAYLDTAVAKLYAESFQKGWDKLGEKGGMTLRTLIAQQEAIVPKQTPADSESTTK